MTGNISMFLTDFTENSQLIPFCEYQQNLRELNLLSVLMSQGFIGIGLCESENFRLLRPPQGRGRLFNRRTT